MCDIAIRVENLSKQYCIGGSPAHYQTIRESLVKAVQGPFRRLSAVIQGKSSSASNEIIWALKDVSFEVARGEVVGIIGRNGAGKTTLLKILSRITEPTQGYAQVRGRVGSLLEVGTGFHPELTGRENVYLNGAILGMKQTEIDRKFDEIVAFAEMDKFIDTPVKHYSSGMGTRLAFAVAAHLEPEILMVDEVLAVGDAAFQKRCLGKMGAVAREGRTVLFVSHNMAAVSSLCDTGILLERGKVSLIGESSDVVRHYLAGIEQRNTNSLRERTDRVGSGIVRLVAFKLSHRPSDAPVADLMMGDPVHITLTVEALERTQVYVGVQVKDAQGQLIFAFNSRESGFMPTIEPGESSVMLYIPHLPLLEGRYTLDASVHRSPHIEPFDVIENIGSFIMYPRDVYSSGKPFIAKHGIVFIEHQWTNSA